LLALLALGLRAQPRLADVLPLRPAAVDAPRAVAFTYGGSGNDVVNAIAVDGQGNAYIAGYTDSKDLPALDGAFRRQPQGYDAFVAKVDAAGRPVWSTYLGGNDARSSYHSPVGDAAWAVAVDPQGNVYVAGQTSSTDFPTANAYQAFPQATARALVATYDGFVAKLSPKGDRLIYATYLGAPDGSSAATALAVGPAGDAWIAITTSAKQFPTDRDLSFGDGGFVVMKLSPGGSPRWSARLGGDAPGGLAVDGRGQVHVTGHARAVPCPGNEFGPRREPPRGWSESSAVAPSPDERPLDCSGAFVAKLDASGSRLVYSTTIGGSQSPFVDGIATTVGNGVAVAPDGSAVVVGTTFATDLPLKGAWQETFGGLGDAFVAVFTPTGALATSSYLGGNGYDGLAGRERVAVDLYGALHVGLNTQSNDLGARRALVSSHVDGPVFTSADRATSWHWASTGVAGSVKDMAVDPERDLIYVATDVGIFRTADSGATWISRNEGLLVPDGSTNQRVGPVDAIALDPRHPHALYAGSWGGLFRSDDGGERWVPMRPAGAGVGGFSARVIAVSPHDGSVWAGSGNGIEVSPDGGRSWASRSRGLPGTVVGTIDSPTVIVFDTRQPGTVYAGLSSGVFGSFDDGASWQDLTRSVSLYPGGPPANPFITAIALDPAAGSAIYAGTFNRGLLKTTDGGRTWSLLLPFTAIRDLALDPVSPSIVYAAVSDYREPRRILQSRDRGETWAAMTDGLTMRGQPSRILVHPRDPRRLYATGSLSDLPYLVRLNPGRPYVPALASYLADGSVRDLAVDPMGETVLALQRVPSSAQMREEIAVVRVGR
jgi:photosystem II stability/assembly factor-like uncharacterized protein